MRKSYLGTINAQQLEQFGTELIPLAHALRANKHDLSVIEVIKLQERVDMKHEEITIAESRDHARRLGNIYGQDRGTGFAGNVWDKNFVSPTITTCQGGGREPHICEVMKVKRVGFIDNGTGQHQSNTVYGTDGVSPAITTVDGGTQQIKVVDAQVLRMVRTEEGKALRKAYENHEIHHGFNEHRQAEPREDGCANTLSTVLKDNHIIETKQLGHIEKGTGKHQSNMVFDADGLCPCICAGMGVKQQPTMHVETQKIETEDYVMNDGNFNQRGKVHSENGVCRTIMGSGHAGNEPKVLQAQQIVVMRGRNPDNPSDRTAGIYLEQRLEPQEDGICNCLTSVYKDNLVLEKKTVKTIKIKQATKDGFVDLEIGGVVDLEYPNSKTRRGRVIDGGQVAPTTTTTTTVPYLVELGNPDFYNFLYEIDGELYLIRIRKLIPLECYRLMAVSNKDAEKMLSVNSNTQCYKQAGNSIVITVLMGIFSQLGISGVRKWNDMTEDEINKMIVGCR